MLSDLFLISAFVWFNAINARKNYDTIFSFNPFSNIFVSVAIILEALFLLGSIYSPIGNTLLGTVAVPKELLVLFIVIALSIFIVDFGFKMTYKGFNFLSTKVKKSKIYLKIISARSFFEGRLTYK